ncbi:hypothetical protein FA13DRAFT_1712753 [Coprinellus micaceus]|uniref:Uncharacterized protein n=1 Tax=Coprinellus micaceus TaxID=71717 RepID=A0A4Y7SZB6_COPMI|nr:hypothetical protein FA13DRAFT_1712753 [Coprinellus micaceus]
MGRAGMVGDPVPSDVVLTCHSDVASASVSVARMQRKCDVQTGLNRVFGRLTQAVISSNGSDGLTFKPVLLWHRQKFKQKRSAYSMVVGERDLLIVNGDDEPSSPSSRWIPTRLIAANSGVCLGEVFTSYIEDEGQLGSLRAELSIAGDWRLF